MCHIQTGGETTGGNMSRVEKRWEGRCPGWNFSVSLNAHIQDAHGRVFKYTTVAANNAFWRT